MALSYGTTKVLNIVLGWICLGLQSYVYDQSYAVAIIDYVFLIIVPICIAEAIISLLLLRVCKKSCGTVGFESLLRGLICFALSFSGGGVIYSAIYIKDDCGDWCQPWEAKLIAGIICVVNAILHGSARKIRNTAMVYAYPAAGQTYPNGPQQPNYMQSPGIPTATVVYQSSTGYPAVGGYQPQSNQPLGFQVQGQVAYQYVNYNPNHPQPISGNYPQQQLISYPQPETGAYPQQKVFTVNQQ